MQGIKFNTLAIIYSIDWALENDEAEVSFSQTRGPLTQSTALKWDYESGKIGTEKVLAVEVAGRFEGQVYVDVKMSPSAVAGASFVGIAYESLLNLLMIPVM